MAALEPRPRVLVLDVNETLSDLSHLRRGVETVGVPDFFTAPDITVTSVEQLAAQLSA